MQEANNSGKIESVHFDISEKETKNLPQPKVENKTPERDYNKVPQKKSVFLLWILFLITLGIYSSIWYLRKTKELYNLGTQKKLPKTLVVFLLILSITEIGALLAFPFTITSEMGTFYQNLSSLQTGLLIIFGAAFCLRIILEILIAFISRGIINEALKSKDVLTKISWFFTLIFGFLYLQYEINRIINDKEHTSRKAPWIIFILILIAFGVASYYWTFPSIHYLN